MNKAEEMKVFARLASDSGFRTWLEEQKEAELRFLVGAPDPMKIYRAQGHVQMLDKLIDTLDAAKQLR